MTAEQPLVVVATIGASTLAGILGGLLGRRNAKELNITNLLVSEQKRRDECEEARRVAEERHDARCDEIIDRYQNIITRLESERDAIKGILDAEREKHRAELAKVRHERNDIE